MLEYLLTLEIPVVIMLLYKISVLLLGLQNVAGVHRFEQFSKTAFNVFIDGICVIEHSRKSPFILVGNSEYSFKSREGNFQIKDLLLEKVSLTDYTKVDGNSSSHKTEIILKRGSELQVRIYTD